MTTSRPTEEMRVSAERETQAINSASRQAFARSNHPIADGIAIDAAGDKVVFQDSACGYRREFTVDQARALGWWFDLRADRAEEWGGASE